MIPGSQSSQEHGFIMGQDMDRMKGGYSAAQALFGNIAEFNLWNKIIKEAEIQNMARSATFPKGNVISWKEDNLEVSTEINCSRI